MNYQEIKKEHQEKIGQLLKDLGAFWAFSNEQLEEEKKKNPLADGGKYVSFGMGGFIAKSKVEELIKGMDKIDDEHKAKLQENKELAEKAILSELRNYECFYTGEIDDVVDFFKGIYTVDQIKKVYKKFNHAKYGA